MLKKLSLMLSIASYGLSCSADTISFPEVWNEINSSSPAQEASRLMVDSLNEARTKASRHWLPKIYVDMRAFQSNDPGDNFFGLLEQRSLQNMDFSTSTINNPGANTFERGAIGLNLPLYEGGMKSSQVDMLNHSVAAQQNLSNQVQIEQYSQVGLSYGAIAVISLEQNRFSELKTEIDHLLKSYKLGSKSNPVGYSGLLGIQSLGNRLKGLMNQYEAQRLSYYSALKEMGLRKINWKPVYKDSTSFVDNYFIDASNGKVENISYKLKSMSESVAAGEQGVKMERARFLPQIGAFAESYTFNGSRQAASGYNAGVYLRWNLFDPSDFGSLTEAKLKSMSSKKYSEALEQQEHAEKTGLVENIKAIRENIKLLDDSYLLLVEQSKMALTLFQSGAINALQIVEILNRRAELISNQCEAELGLLKMATQVATKEQFDISQRLMDGAKK